MKLKKIAKITELITFLCFYYIASDIKTQNNFVMNIKKNQDSLKEV